jgi:hypothetical protein
VNAPCLSLERFESRRKRESFELNNKKRFLNSSFVNCIINCCKGVDDNDDDDTAILYMSSIYVLEIIIMTSSQPSCNRNPRDGTPPVGSGDEIEHKKQQERDRRRVRERGGGERCRGGNITNITFVENHGGCADF